MKASPFLNVPNLAQSLTGLLRRGQPKVDLARFQTPEEPPLRAELFSVDQLERHAAGLAGSHELASSLTPDKLIARLHDNEHVLTETYDLVTAAVSANRRISPAAEWLLDNFY